MRSATRPVIAPTRRLAARDPRTMVDFPHGRIAILLIVLAALTLSGFTGGAGEARATAAPTPAPTAAHPNALCFGRLDMREELAAYATDRWEICYRRGLDVARLRIRGSGASDFDCVVYGPDGRIVAYDDGVHDACVLDWRVRATGNHRVEIHSLGDAANPYALVTR